MCSFLAVLGCGEPLQPLVCRSMLKKKTPDSITVRFEPEMMAYIRDKAKKERRSICATIVLMLESQMEQEQVTK